MQSYVLRRDATSDVFACRYEGIGKSFHDDFRNANRACLHQAKGPGASLRRAPFFIAFEAQRLAATSA
jgi:hypothetical protein